MSFYIPYAYLSIFFVCPEVNIDEKCYTKYMKKWRSGIVQHGDKTGRTLGFPTINFDPCLVQDLKRDGVYAADVVIEKEHYRGAVYIGPRLTLGETSRVLEIHVLDYTGNIYGHTVKFRIGGFVRPPMDFASETDLKDQLANDILAVRSATI